MKRALHNDLAEIAESALVALFLLFKELSDILLLRNFSPRNVLTRGSSDLGEPKMEVKNPIYAVCKGLCKGNPTPKKTALQGAVPPNWVPETLWRASSIESRMLLRVVLKCCLPGVLESTMCRSQCIHLYVMIEIP